MNEPQISAESVTGITMYGADWCGDCTRAKRFFDERGVTYEWIDLEADPSAADRAREIGGRPNIPVIVYPDGTNQVEPSNHELEAKLTELTTP